MYSPLVLFLVDAHRTLPQQTSSRLRISDTRREITSVALIALAPRLSDADDLPLWRDQQDAYDSDDSLSRLNLLSSTGGAGRSKGGNAGQAEDIDGRSLPSRKEAGKAFGKRRGDNGKPGYPRSVLFLAY